MELAHLYYQLKQVDEAEKVLEDLMVHTDNPGQNAVNILAELLMTKGQHSRALKLIKRKLKDQVLGIDLKIKCGVCLLYMGKEEEAATYLKALEERSPTLDGDLYLTAAEAYARNDMPGM